jgi:hypothetical protein
MLAGPRVVDRFAEVTMMEPVANVRMEAGARAVEMALGHRVGLASILGSCRAFDIDAVIIRLF